ASEQFRPASEKRPKIGAPGARRAGRRARPLPSGRGDIARGRECNEREAERKVVRSILGRVGPSFIVLCSQSSARQAQKWTRAFRIQSSTLHERRLSIPPSV